MISILYDFPTFDLEKLFKSVGHFGKPETRLCLTQLVKFNCTTFHSVFATNFAFAAKPIDPLHPNSGLSNAKLVQC